MSNIYGPTSFNSDFMYSIQVSISGMLVVFFALVSLSLFIILCSKILMFIEKAADNGSSKVAPEGSKSAVVEIEEEDLDEEAYAVLISVISEEIGEPLDKFSITGIKSID